MLIYSLLTGIVTILFAAGFLRKIHLEPAVPENIAAVARAITTGANSYLARQLKTISVVVFFLFLLLHFIFGWKTSVAFVLGVYTSLLSSFIGMKSATYANSRVASAARTSKNKAFQLSVLSGAITGLSVPGLSLVVLSTLYLIFRDPTPLVGFGFGGSLAALFAQIGGGIFTKSADIGADLVGKVEQGLPEDDPRNPAVIADLVGDNVGDCAGRGSDLFQTFSDDIVTGTLLAATMVREYGPNVIYFPFLLQGCGVFSSLIGILATRKAVSKLGPERSFNLGLVVSSIISCLSSFILIHHLFTNIQIWYGALFGVLMTLLIAVVTRYYAGVGGYPVEQISTASGRGAALNLITALSYGLQSAVPAIIMVVGAIVGAYSLSGGSLMAILAVNIGTDLLVGYIMTADAFGPVVDNAAGISEMSGGSEEAVRSLSALDSVGNTMKAITKAYAMSSGTVTAFVVFATFSRLTGVFKLDLVRPETVGFILLGVALPFFVSSLVIGAAARGALLVVDEVRRQFREIAGLLEGTAEPDYARCVDASTRSALREMVVPGLISFLTPMLVGLIFGAKLLTSLLIGAVVASGLLGPFFNNVGTALDNAKKLIEQEEGLKGSFRHAAAVIGDTVGDPLKDVAGPALLILMKLVGMSSLLIAPLLF